MNERVEHILFDLGVVLVHLDYEPALEKLVSHCDPDRVRSGVAVFSLLQRDPIIAEYERGRVERAAR